MEIPNTIYRHWHAWNPATEEWICQRQIMQTEGLALLKSRASLPTAEAACAATAMLVLEAFGEPTEVPLAELPM